MYFTRNQLEKKEGLSPEESLEIWNENYFNGWKHHFTLGAVVLTVVAIYLLSLPSWSWLNLFLLIHVLIATPIASRDMKNKAKKLKS